MSIWIVIIVLVGLFWIWVLSGLQNEKKKEKSFYQKWIGFDGKKPDAKKYVLDRDVYQKHIQDSNRIDEITWNDLNMDLVFERLDYTNSSIGEEMLYRMLASPIFEKEQLKHRDEVISYFQNNKEQRVKLQIQFAKIGKTGRVSVFDMISFADEMKDQGIRKDILVLILMGLTILTSFFYGKALIIFGVLLIYNFLNYINRKAKIGPYLATYGYILRMMKEMDKLSVEEYPCLKIELQKMLECQNALKNFRKGAFIALHSNGTGSNPFDVIWYYLCMCFHFDLIKFYKMQNQLHSHENEIKLFFETAGMIEAYLSLSLFRESIAHYCYPEFVNRNSLNCEEIYHPLIDHPVCNNLYDVQAMLLTGSNASGKSTLLKTIAINMIFAQTIATVLAESYQSDMGYVYSCMSLRDDITKGDSYFLAEIKALKRIMDASVSKPVFCFVDEVLRGTNTTERIAAATEILKQLQNQCAFCMAATHDLELTTLLDKEYENYHFEETLLNDDVTFSYKLLKGAANTQNAIELLRILGFSSSVIDNAKKRVNERK